MRQTQMRAYINDKYACPTLTPGTQPPKNRSLISSC